MRTARCHPQRGARKHPVHSPHGVSSHPAAARYASPRHPAASRRGGPWTNSVEGVITRFQQAKTGSWFAHAKDDQLWLDRLELRLDDGELVILNLDQYSVIERQ